MVNGARWVGLVLALVLAAGCKRYIRIDDPGGLEYHPADADFVRARRAALDHDLAAGPVSLRIEGQAPAAEWTVVARFVHVSDVQLRDRGIRYFTKKREQLVSTVASATHRNDDLDQNDEYPLLALVGGVNALVEAGSGSAPDFVIHTGDAVDAGSLGELLEFVAVANELKVPWFDVLGNHDVFLMGNFTEDHVIVEGAPASGLPWVLNRARFMEAHGANRAVPSSHPPTEAPAGGRVPASRYHGFDCLTPSCTACAEDAATLRPYYSVRLETQPPIRLVVLDTTVAHERIPRVRGGEVPAIGASGYIEAEQFRWLQRELASAHDAGEAVTVFGHHPLTVEHASFGFEDLRGTNPEGKADALVLDLLKSERNVLGYFGGHTHTARVKRHSDRYRGSYGFWEVIGPSLHEYPQTANWVEVLRRGDELALRVRPVRGDPERNPVVRDALATACRGARTHAKQAPEGACSTDVGLLEAALAARVPPPKGRTRGVARAGQQVDCGVAFLNASVDCRAPGAAATRAADAPVALPAGRAAEWKREATCDGASAAVGYRATCSVGSPREVDLALAATLRARADAPAAGGGASAAGWLAPQWTVPVRVTAPGARVRIAGPPAATLACRSRLDAFPEAPLAERSAWAVDAVGEHTLVVTCEAVAAACDAGAACERERKVDARLAVTVE